MELFIPSFIVIVLSAFVATVLLPKMGPYVVGFLALALFAVGIWQNYKMFPYEYKSTMVLQTLREYAPFVMVTFIILGAMIMTMSLYGPSPPSIPSVIPEAVPANIVKANIKANNTTNKEPSFFNLSGNTNTNTNTKNVVANVQGAKRNNTTANKGNNIASTSFKVV